MLKHLTKLALLAALVPFHHGVQAEQDWLYSVRPGDNIWDLCIKHTTKSDCWLELGDYNSLVSDQWLPPGMILRFPVSWLKSTPTPVTISYFSGDVSYRSAPGQASSPATVGDKLPIGSEVLTGDKSVAGLVFGDGSVMQLEPNSSVVLDSLSTPGGSGFVDSRIRLQTGAVKTRVPERQPKSRFQISTPAAIAAVRGTEFRVSAFADQAGKPAMTGEVFEGEVGVQGAGSGAAKSVAAGYGITAKKGVALADPKPLPPAPEWMEIAAVQTPPISASWQAGEQARGYRLEILSLDEQQQAELLAVQTIAANEFTDTSQAYTRGCYLLALRALDDDGLMGKANKSQVCIREQLEVPELSSPTVKFGKDTTAVDLAWQPVAGADGYRLQVSRDASFNTLAASYDVTAPEYQLALDASGLDEGFYYRVQARGEDVVNSDYSPSGEAKRQDEPLAALAAWATFWVLLIAL